MFSSPASPAATSDLPRLTLVLGGARSGKSLYAEALIGTRPALYLATGQGLDRDMRERIERHRLRRGPNWTTRDTPVALAAALREADRPVLVDCLTLWLTNLLHAEVDPVSETRALIAALSAVSVPVVLVSNEVGLGIVPDNKLARDFRDHAGRIHQSIAAVASRVVFVAAGLPLTLKDTP